MERLIRGLDFCGAFRVHILRVIPMVRIYSVLFFVLGRLLLFAQKGTVTGTVRAMENGALQPQRASPTS